MPLLPFASARGLAITPGSPDTAVQFNSAGVFGGSANLTWLGDVLLIGDSAAIYVAGRITAGPVTESQQPSLEITPILTPTDDGFQGTAGRITASTFEDATHWTSLTGALLSAQYYGTGQVDTLAGAYIQAYAQSSPVGGDVVTAYAVQAGVTVSAPNTIGTIYGYAYTGVSTAAISTTQYAFFSSDLGNVASTSVNPYYFWADDNGVFRIKSDNTFDSVYQAIPALYNPQFTKYTPGAFDFERIQFHWAGNVATFGVVVGGTGTNRVLNLIGSAVQANGAVVATASNALAFTNKTGNISQWTNDAGYGTGTGNALTGNPLSQFAATTSLQLKGVISDETGSGLLVFATSPALTTPLLGTPTSGDLSNCTNFPTGSLSGLGSGVATFLTTPSSANLLAAITDETGTGALVFANTPTLVTPVIGAATGTSLALTSTVTSTQSLAANTSGDGLILTNPAVASSGNQEFSPRIRLTGQGWKTTATAASQTVDFIAELQPVQGAASPTANLVFSSQVNAAGYTPKFTLGSDGSATIASNKNLWLVTGQSRLYAPFNGTVFLGNAANYGLYFDAAGCVLPSAGYYAFSNSAADSTTTVDTWLYRGGAAATLQMGANVNGAAISQTLQAANGITGTDKTGGNFTLASGKGTGAGAVSSLVFQTPTVLSTGTTAQSLASRLTISSAGSVFTGKTSSPTKNLSTIYTVATLPAGVEGDIAAVNDALAPVFLGALTGSGTVHTPVYYNGSAWVAF